MVTKKKITIVQILLLILLLGTYGAVNDALALDAPHDTTSTVTVACANCHPTRGTTQPWMTQPQTNDVTLMNNQCFQCHNLGGGLSTN